MNLKILIIFCALTFFTHKCEISAESFKCTYSVKKFFISYDMYNKYSCELTLNNFESSENENEIADNHDDPFTDGDVENLESSSNLNLKKFSSNFCNKFSNLKAINFKNVEMNLIDHDALNGCSNLEFLCLKSVGISDIPESIFTENAKLIEIEISSNKIESLSVDTFEMQEKLKNLRLENNKINYLPSNVFKNLKNLEILNLNNNQIECLDAKWFKNLKKLQKLSLNLNKIANLPKGAFVNLNQLRMLELNSNQLSVINSNAFGSHPTLAFVDLSSNQIVAVDRQFFISGPINTLKMTDNECFDDDINYRQDEELETCYNNFNDDETSSTCIKSSTISPITSSISSSVSSKPPPAIIPPFKPLKIVVQYTPYPVGDYPWIAAIMIVNVKGQSKYGCGGVLISSTKIVTAASCLFLKNENRYLLYREIQIVLGSRKIFQPFETGKSAFAIETFRVNPGFDKSSPSSDANIAVIFLESAPKTNKYINPIGFPESTSHILSITNAVFVSHGSNESLVTKSDVTAGYLQTKILNNEKCPKSKQKETFCIGGESEDPTCVDVIGSGLFVKYNDRFHLRGILTFVSGSCDIDSYSHFTDISNYADWIKEVSNQELIPEGSEEVEIT